ncbi:MAG: glycine cleavage system aminomethyltransferase GcvT [Planctomycetota bacterium]|nr:glycine cleavage system aminomethyltransferase GcvT [Planctomycetota bacterium]
MATAPVTASLAQSSLAQTPLHAWHEAHGGRMVDFAGWSMPVHYGSIVAEHTATRTACGLFDVSHMGRLRFVGPGAAEFLDSVVTRRLTDMQLGQIRYGLVTNDIGGILDDVLVYRLPAPTVAHPANLVDSDHFVMVVNASNREKIVQWLNDKLAGRDDVKLEDLTTIYAMIAVQGPLARQLVEPLFDADLHSLKYYHGMYAATKTGWPALVSRTGYTGEDGYEIIVLENGAVEVWEAILAAGKDQGARACGLGCRDTLRLEAAMPLYGHELSESINPLQAGLDFAVNLEKRSFCGSWALLQARQSPLPQVRVGLELTGKRVPREHYSILAGKAVAGDAAIGEITSGTFSPTLDRPIAMGYVAQEFSAVGTELQIDIRGGLTAARVVRLPFYSRKK